MKKPFTSLAIFIFLLVALLHVIRLMFSWPVTVDGAGIPLWVSAVGALVAMLLALLLWKER
jgi:hypothetical protein